MEYDEDFEPSHPCEVEGMPCPHCFHWYEGYACCACGDPAAETEDELDGY
jgi:hypothetical protein